MSLIQASRTAYRTISRTPGPFVHLRTKVTASQPAFDFNALEPHISGQINELHFTKHHQTYASNYNNFSEQLAEALHRDDTTKQAELLPLLNFNGGGVANHNLFWENLAPVKEGGGQPPAEGSNLARAISASYGDLEKLIAATNAKLAGIQGSGWAWVVRHKATGRIDVISTANQDQVPAAYVPLVGIDAWEHAYYLQYKNVKADYFKAIWNVVNWKEAEKRFEASV